MKNFKQQKDAIFLYQNKQNPEKILGVCAQNTIQCRKQKEEYNQEN